MRKKLALLISGNGTTAEVVIKACKNGGLTDFDPFVISSRKDALGIERTRNLGVETFVVDRDSFTNIDDFGDELLKKLDEQKTDFILLCGWLPLITSNIIEAFRNKIINQHPGALDPGRAGFGGKGLSNPFRVTCAAISYCWLTGEKPWIESDIHFVTENFDSGELLRILKVDLPFEMKKMTLDEIKKNKEDLIEKTKEAVRLLYPVEYKNVIQTLQKFADGKIEIVKREKPLIPKENVEFLESAKELAIELFPHQNLVVEEYK